MEGIKSMKDLKDFLYRNNGIRPEEVDLDDEYEEELDFVEEHKKIPMEVRVDKSSNMFEKMSNYSIHISDEDRMLLGKLAVDTDMSPSNIISSALGLFADVSARNALDKAR